MEPSSLTASALLRPCLHVVFAILLVCVVVSCSNRTDKAAAEAAADRKGIQIEVASQAELLALPATIAAHRKASPDQPVTAWINPGHYRLSDAEVLRFGAEHSGTASASVTIRSLPGQREATSLSGAIALEASQFVPVSEPDQAARLRPEVRTRVRELDLAAIGVTPSIWPDAFDDAGGLPGLYVGGQRQTLSIYPEKAGAMTMERAVRNGDKTTPGIFTYRAEHAEHHAAWAKAVDRGVWLKGYWRVVWQNEALRVAAIDPDKRQVSFVKGINGGIGNKYRRPHGNGKEIYWVLNLLEEVDRPGEWCIDFKSNKLYLLPPDDFETAEIELAVVKSPLLTLDKGSHIRVKNLRFEKTLGEAVHIRSGECVELLGCLVEHAGGDAVRIQEGRGHRVQSCELRHLGAGGVMVTGGDASTSPRTPAGHEIVNNHIHDFGLLKRVYAAGVQVGYKARTPTVGVRVANNLIHTAPHVGILFEGFDSVFEHNEIHSFCEISNDMGGIYSYYKEASSGYNVIHRNFIHTTPEGDGIYFDQDVNHATVTSNVVVRMALSEDAVRGIGILLKNINGGLAEVRDNTVLECGVGYQLNLRDGWGVHDNYAGANRVPWKLTGAPFKTDSNGNRTETLALSEGERPPLPYLEGIGLFPDAYRSASEVEAALALRERVLQQRAASTSGDGYNIGDRK